MRIIGLHIVDIFVILLYIAVILYLGKRAADKTKDTRDFFLAGRKLGKFYQFFLNFGCSTNADQAVAVSREIYRVGIGGMWTRLRSTNAVGTVCAPGAIYWYCNGVYANFGGDGGFVSKFGGGTDFYITEYWALTLDVAYVLPAGSISELQYVNLGWGVRFNF